ncbi:MAG TPA: acyltransferase [Candidatus Hydrogenedentes bacterium]|nr:acyltransferase [Candidatus Hydrogenedentota bacterium]HPG67276.1 acyltransferase [Candidatus Hydrogenedentota bacterium]
MAASSAQETSKQRASAFDAFRGVAMFLVVIVHAGILGFGFRNVEGGAFNFYYSVFLRDVCICAVQVFLFVSGYWLAGARIESWGDYGRFLRRRASRVLVPYLVWSLFLFGLRSVRSGSFSLPDLIVQVATGQVEGHFFFIVMVLQFYLLVPLFLRMERRGLVGLIIIHVLYVAYLYWLRLAVFQDMPFIYVKLPFLAWLTFFPLGMYVRRHPELIDRGGMGRAAMVAVVCLLASFAESLVLLRLDRFEFALSDIKYTTLLYGAAVIVLLMRTREKRWPRVLVMLGDYSFGIYLIHGILLRAIAAKLAVIPGLYDVQPLFYVVVTLATLVPACAMIWVVRRVLGRDRAGAWLGF